MKHGPAVHSNCRQVLEAVRLSSREARLNLERATQDIGCRGVGRATRRTGSSPQSDLNGSGWLCEAKGSGALRARAHTSPTLFLKWDGTRQRPATNAAFVLLLLLSTLPLCDRARFRLHARHGRRHAGRLAELQGTRQERGPWSWPRPAAAVVGSVKPRVCNPQGAGARGSTRCRRQRGRGRRAIGPRRATAGHGGGPFFSSRGRLRPARNATPPLPDPSSRTSDGGGGGGGRWTAAAHGGARRAASARGTAGPREMCGPSPAAGALPGLGPGRSRKSGLVRRRRRPPRTAVFRAPCRHEGSPDVSSSENTGHATSLVD